ncbi:MAG: hydantoinase/oxoprolinase family protein [Pseudomonadota bacterium]
MMRVGIDVGGTHTDAVLLRGDEILAAHKALTSADIVSGILDALEHVLAAEPDAAEQLDALMLGTTQFTNAVVERRELSPVAAIRIGAPSGRGVPPMIGWPDDIQQALGAHSYTLHGGYLYDGWPMAPMDDDEIGRVVADVVARDLPAVAIAGAFSPMNPDQELMVAERLRAANPDLRITMSHEIGRLGLLERENAALLNAGLLHFADRVVTAFEQAVAERGLQCRFFLSQNDGTLMDAAFARRFPALTFASGPTNSIRGACRLSGLSNAIVVDIGGTTSDIGVLQDDFPRESNRVIEVGGVRTNFRMPDILAVGLGGGSEVSADGATVGPRSVGHALPERGLVFGGDTLTATDIAVAAGVTQLGDAEHLSRVPAKTVATARETMQRMLADAIDTMKPSRAAIPVVLVGGGAVLFANGIDGVDQVIRPENAGVANALGAAIAQIGGEQERMIAYDQTPRDKAIEQVTAEAHKAAIVAGADPDTVRIADVEETAMSYMAGNTTRVRVKVVGDILTAGSNS